MATWQHVKMAKWHTLIPWLRHRATCQKKTPPITLHTWVMEVNTAPALNPVADSLGANCMMAL